MQTNQQEHPLLAVIAAVERDHNRLWETGTIAEDSVLRHVEQDLVAVQYSPKFEGGAWRATSGTEWVEGTAEAGAVGGGKGWRWTIHDVTVVPRGDDECFASYRVHHTWGEPDRAAAQAIFLETWRRGQDGRWRLARHTAEKG